MLTDKELADLDGRVAEAQGWYIAYDPDIELYFWADADGDYMCAVADYQPTINGQQAMDALHEYDISVFRVGYSSNKNMLWGAMKSRYPVDYGNPHVTGPTPEIAICRAVVASKETTDEQ